VLARALAHLTEAQRLELLDQVRAELERTQALRDEAADRIGAALDLLARRGQAKRSQHNGNGGRPTEVWVSYDKNDVDDKRS
jgi:hypothetical protein